MVFAAYLLPCHYLPMTKNELKTIVLIRNIRNPVFVWWMLLWEGRWSCHSYSHRPSPCQSFYGISWKKLATKVWSSRSDFVEKCVGNIICIFNCESDTENIFLYLNLGDKNILFTFEKEQQNKKISFLYVLIFKDVLILASKFQFIVQSINRLIY